MTTSAVTTVGRLLRSKHGEPRRLRVIAVATTGQVHTVSDRQLSAQKQQRRG